MISKETATDIAMTHREIEVAEKLLDDVKATMEKSPFGEKSDLRDVFGRQHDGLELGVPSGDTSKRLFRLPYKLAVPVIQAHIAEARARLLALNETAASELKLGVATAISAAGGHATERKANGYRQYEKVDQPHAGDEA